MRHWVWQLVLLFVGISFMVWAQAAGRPLEAQGPCDRYVLAPQGSDAGDCSDPLHPCLTIPYALGNALSGDSVCVADNVNVPGPSVYFGRVVITRTVTLDGAWAAGCDGSGCAFTSTACLPDNVHLDGFGQIRVVEISGTITPTVRCFTIAHGNAAGRGGDPDGNDAGGGVYSKDAAPVIAGNVISSNYGCNVCPTAYGRGGGIYLLNAPATALITGNVVVGNVADNSTWGEGGGLMLRNSAAQVRNNLFLDNRAGLSAGYGGGIAVVDGAPTLADNRIEGNLGGQAVQGLGGGIYVWISTAPADGAVTVERNVIRSNLALTGTASPGLIGGGGGIHYRTEDPAAILLLRDNTIEANRAASAAPGRGGGVQLEHAGSGTVVSGNTVTGNTAGLNPGQGGGIYMNQCQATVLENRIVDNYAASGGSSAQGGGLFVLSGAGQVLDNVITGNRASGDSTDSTGLGGGMVISDSAVLVQGNWIAENVASSSPILGWAAGGGIFADLGAPQIAGNQVLSNTAGPGLYGQGGGIYTLQGSPAVLGNTVVGNQAVAAATARGGGVNISGSPAFTMTNNIVARNQASDQGSGVAIGSSSGQLDFNTIVANGPGDGAGVYVSGFRGAYTVTLIDNIVATQTVGITNVSPADATVDARYTLYDGNVLNYGPGVNSTLEVAGPAALLPNYHLSAGSNAINHALLLPGVTDDIDGDPRPIGPAPDVGADEYVARIYLPLVLRNSAP